MLIFTPKEKKMRASYPKKFLEKFNLKRAEIEDNKKFIHHLPMGWYSFWIKFLIVIQISDLKMYTLLQIFTQFGLFTM